MLYIDGSHTFSVRGLALRLTPTAADARCSCPGRTTFCISLLPAHSRPVAGGTDRLNCKG
jgi:hypothetical protein